MPVIPTHEGDAVAGQAKYAHRLANHLDSPIDAACMVGIDDAAGFDGTGWLAVGPDAFVLVGGDAWMGRPRGVPIATVPYAEVTGVDLTPGACTTRADVELVDRRTVAFDVRRGAAGTQDLEVLELLVRRCGEPEPGVGA